jgi:hypothetical protein
MSEPPPREPHDERTPVPVRDRADGYFRNGTWVPRDAEPDPRPGWRERIEGRLGIRFDDRRLWVGAAALALVLLVIVVLVLNRGDEPLRVPKREHDFLAAVRQGQSAVRAGNDLTVVTADRDRNSSVCAWMPANGKVTNWLGTLTDVGTVLGSKQGEVAVSIGDSVKLHTWSHASQDGKDHTLVDPNSDVYRSLSKLKPGAKVVFSGSFRPDGPLCLHETSLFARNGMLTPGFVFRFTSVAPR